MRAFVFTDKSLGRHAGRFVWLEIDTEKRENAALRRRLQVPALPTFFILDPADERVALRWVGGATVRQLDQMLDEGRLAVARGAAGADTAGTRGGAKLARAASAADLAFAQAERHYGAGDMAAAAADYRRALAAAPPGWPRYARAVESALFALQESDDNEAVALLARDAFPTLRATPSSANVAASGIGGALALPKDHPKRRELVRALEADAEAVVRDPEAKVAADDRSGAYIALLDIRHDEGDSTGAMNVASRWSAFLDGEAAKATAREQRTVFDAHRLSAYLEIGHPERAIPMLEASERDFPEDYNPPARLATAYKAMKRWDDALAASDRALARAYGPRKLRLLQTRSEIQIGRGDAAAARRTLEEAVAMAEALPEGQRSESTIASLKKQLSALP